MMNKKVIILLVAVSLSVVLLPSVFSRLFLYKIPVYVMGDPCAGKQIIASIDFSKYSDISQVPNDWIIKKNTKTNNYIIEIRKGVLRLSEAHLGLNTSKHKMPINATVFVTAKVNASGYYLNYKGYSEADLFFHQNLNAKGKGYIYSGAFIFSRSGGRGSGVTIRDSGYNYKTSNVRGFSIRNEHVHYQSKSIGINRHNFNNYTIKRVFEQGNFMKSFYINGQLYGEMNLTKPYPDSSNKKFNYNEGFAVTSYPYQAIYVKKVEICE